jgi:hypothetical protein
MFACPPLYFFSSIGNLLYVQNVFGFFETTLLLLLPCIDFFGSWIITQIATARLAINETTMQPIQPISRLATPAFAKEKTVIIDIATLGEEDKCSALLF